MPAKLDRSSSWQWLSPVRWTAWKLWWTTNWITRRLCWIPYGICCSSKRRRLRQGTTASQCWMGPASPWTELQQWIWWLSGLGGNNQTRARQPKKLDESWTWWYQGGGVYHLIMPRDGFLFVRFSWFPFLPSHVSMDFSLVLASITLFSVSSSIITVQACDTPVPCYGERGQLSSLAYKRMYAFRSSLLISSHLFYSCFVDKSQGAPHVSQISLNLNLNLFLYER